MDLPGFTRHVEDSIATDDSFNTEIPENHAYHREDASRPAIKQSSLKPSAKAFTPGVNRNNSPDVGGSQLDDSVYSTTEQNSRYGQPVGPSNPMRGFPPDPYAHFGNIGQSVAYNPMATMQHFQNRVQEPAQPPMLLGYGGMQQQSRDHQQFDDVHHIPGMLPLPPSPRQHPNQFYGGPHMGHGHQMVGNGDLWGTPRASQYPKHPQNNGNWGEDGVGRGLVQMHQHQVPQVPDFVRSRYDQEPHRRQQQNQGGPMSAQQGQGLYNAPVRHGSMQGRQQQCGHVNGNIPYHPLVLSRQMEMPKMHGGGINERHILASRSLPAGAPLPGGVHLAGYLNRNFRFPDPLAGNHHVSQGSNSSEATQQERGRDRDSEILTSSASTMNPSSIGQSSNDVFVPTPIVSAGSAMGIGHTKRPSALKKPKSSFNSLNEPFPESFEELASTAKANKRVSFTTEPFPEYLEEPASTVKAKKRVSFTNDSPVRHDHASFPDVSPVNPRRASYHV